MKKLLFICLLVGGFVWAQGPKSTGKIKYDDKAELIKKMQNDYTKNDFNLFESLMVDTLRAYLGSTDKVSKRDLINGFKSHHQLYKDINWGWLNSETATYEDGSKWTMVWASWKGEGNFTGTKNSIPGHFAYQWKGDKIVTALYYFDPTSLRKEIAAMTSQSIDYGYEATYSSNWKIGNPENIKVVLDVQKGAEKNDFEAVKKNIHSEIIIGNGDGTVIRGIEAFSNTFESFLKNFKISVNPAVWIAVESDEGDEWVLLWTNEEYTDAEGKTKKIAAQESFQIKDGKIIRVNQFQKPNNN